MDNTLKNMPHKLYFRLKIIFVLLLLLLLTSTACVMTQYWTMSVIILGKEPKVKSAFKGFLYSEDIHVRTKGLLLQVSLCSKTTEYSHIDELHSSSAWLFCVHSRVLHGPIERQSNEYLYSSSLMSCCSWRRYCITNWSGSTHISKLYIVVFFFHLWVPVQRYIRLAYT
jgi:hypothetical protein